MEIKVQVEDMQKMGIFLATPMYGGQCSGMYTRSIADLTALCSKYKIPLQFYFLFNESLITRARNYCCDEFLRSKMTHLMFIDSDIGFNANDVIAMLALSMQEKNMDIVCGPYPKKTISWEKVKAAVDKGVADDDPRVLENFVGDYVFNPKSGQGGILLSEPVEVMEGGTGFMLIKRETFEVYDKAYPELLYKPDHVRTDAFDGSREIMAYFDCIIDPESKRYLSEDYMFCYAAQRAGLKVWLCPWIQLKHVGSYIFGGSLADLASVGAAATADVGLLNKAKNNKKKKKK
jgi:hypothetical protein